MADKKPESNKLVPVDTSDTAKAMEIDGGGVAIQNVSDAIQFCTWCVESGMLPREINTPKKAFAIMARGGELGLKPFTAWRFIYQTKSGKLSIESKGALAVCQASPVFEDYKEFTEGKGNDIKAVAQAKRKGRSAVTKEFSYDQALRAGLLRERRTAEGKSYKTPWEGYLEDMLLSKARSRALDIAFGDVLGGMQIREEVEEIDRLEEERRGPAVATGVKDPLLDDLEETKKPKEVQEIIDAQVEEILPPKAGEVVDAEMPEYQGEVKEMLEEPPEPEEARVHVAECQGCGVLYAHEREACPECGLAKGQKPPPPPSENPFEKGKKRVQEARKKGQQNLLSDD